VEVENRIVLAANVAKKIGAHQDIGQYSMVHMEVAQKKPADANILM
jgi:hypothetical protein